ncbi:UbiA-like polyprenyltransferase [Desulfothermus sp.]
MGNKFKLFLHMIKIEHSLFALPFAYIGCFLANSNWPGLRVFLLISIAMVGMRSFAMAMNRIIDLKFDKINPRTQDRPLVTGEITLKESWLFSIIFALIFVVACYGLNKLCFYLSFIALVWGGLYSFSKRFTSLCHFWLGSVLAMAPIGGWLGVDPHVRPVPVTFAFGVLFWVAGFDILYSIQDVDFDREQGLFSLPSKLGVKSALWISCFSHIISIIFFFLGGWVAGLGMFYFIGWLIVSCILIFEHLIVNENSLDKISVAFFQMNAYVSCILLLAVLIDIFWVY